MCHVHERRKRRWHKVYRCLCCALIAYHNFHSKTTKAIFISCKFKKIKIKCYSKKENDDEYSSLDKYKNYDTQYSLWFYAVFSVTKELYPFETYHLAVYYCLRTKAFIF